MYRRQTKSINKIRARVSIKDKNIFNIVDSSLSLLVMAGSIRLFQFVQNYCQTMGIIHSVQSQPIHLPFNWRKLYFSISMLLMFIATFDFFLLGADSVGDYSTSFYNAISQLYSIVDFIINCWHNKHILMLIVMFEKHMETSK